MGDLSDPIRQEPLPAINGDPKRSNLRSKAFTRDDFLQGRITKEEVIDIYKKIPIQNRGPTIAINEHIFNQQVGINMAPSASYASNIATIGLALFIYSNGRHQKIDFRQPVGVPPKHCLTNFALIIRIQEMLGFPHEKRDFECGIGHEDGSRPDGRTDKGSIWDAACLFADRMLGLDCDDAADD